MRTGRAVRFSRGASLRAGLGALLFFVAAGCAPTYADGYLETLAAGQRAQNAGRWQEAADNYEAAAKLGHRYKDRDEARLMAAEALERLGKFEQAEASYRKIEIESDGRYQGVRAAFALGRVVWEQRGFELGSRELLRAVRKYPASGLVRHTVRRLLEEVEDTQGMEAALNFIEPIYRSLLGSEAEEAVGFERAGVLSRLERREEALAAYLAQARKFSYPHGSLTDDAFYRASFELEALGRPKEAIAVLDEMLEPREEAYAGASYERPRFPEAAFRKAVLLRDAIGDRQAAIEAFGRVHEAHFHSRLADDALWEKAKLERALNATKAACKSLETLAEDKPDSRYLRCASLLCPSRDVSTARPCPPYIAQSLQPGAQGEAAAP